MNPTQTIYFVQSLLNASTGNTPVIRMYATLDEAQSAWNDIVNQGTWGGDVVNYIQIMTVEATVIQATDGAPSGPVTMP